MGEVAGSMTAAYITTTCPPAGIRVGELPVPVPGPTDVLVRTTALGVNAVDTFVRSGAYRTPTPFPFVIGRDLVGTVAACGSGVSELTVGEPVWCNSLGHAGRQGSFAAYALVPAERLYRLPPGVDPVTAVSLLHPVATAYLALFREASLRPGQVVVVGGAGGGVGSALVQLATIGGARVIATAGSADLGWVHDCGADTVLDYRAPQLSAQIQAAAPGGVDVYVDTSGQHDLEASVPLLATAGRIIVLAALAAHPALPVGALYTKDASVRGFVISNASVADLGSAASMINSLLERGSLRTRISLRLPLSEAARAHQLLEDHDPSARPGRIVVLP